MKKLINWDNKGKGYLIKSPLANMIAGVIAGAILYYLIGDKDVKDAAGLGLLMGLFFNTIDYGYVYYFEKRKGKK